MNWHPIDYWSQSLVIKPWRCILTLFTSMLPHRICIDTFVATSLHFVSLKKYGHVRNEYFWNQNDIFIIKLKRVCTFLWRLVIISGPEIRKQMLRSSNIWTTVRLKTQDSKVFKVRFMKNIGSTLMQAFIILQRSAGILLTTLKRAETDGLQ